MVNYDDIVASLEEIIHPEFDKGIVTLGMVNSLVVSEDGTVKFILKTTKTRDPFIASIKKLAENKIESISAQSKGKISIIIQEPAPKSKKESPTKTVPKDNQSIKNIIAISSCKGGVGKSTVTANLAVTLAKMGYKVGVIDADVYGPSMPKMFGTEDYTPMADEKDGAEVIIPAEKYGVKIMSIGYFIKPSDALAWRGPMATNALKQLVHQTLWGELDFLLIDLPPGTGDVHLTMLSELKFSGAVIVSTPQGVALADVVRGISMFNSKNIAIPVLGIIENMAWFTPKELPENRYYIFGKEGAKKLANEMNIDLLAQIPIIESAGEGGDSGHPAALTDELLSPMYNQLADNIIKKLNRQD